MSRQTTVLGTVATALLACLPGIDVALAQSAAGHGIAGFWSPSFGATPPRRDPTETEAALIASLPDDVVLLADSGAVEFPPGDYGGLDVHDHLIAAAEDYDPNAQRTVATTCQPPGVIYSMQGPFPMEIFEGRDLIVIKLEYFDLVRIIFMNEMEHPENWPHSMTGHSIGRWDGDTLVVDTVDLQVGTLFNNGVNHTEDVHLIERFRLADDDTLIVLQQFEDPGSFSGTAARVISLNRRDDHVYPYDCDPTYGLSIDARQGPDD
ncbi:MAG: hypothetical protein PVF63_02310 [Gammaproteobacteria bacterium]|jgi:hypothetical protein